MSDPQKCSLNHHHKKFVVTAVTDPRQTSQVETGYRETNACLEWIKYFVCTLSKKQNNCFVCAAGRTETQVVPFPIDLSSKVMGMEYMISLYQDSMAWGNSMYKILLPFPTSKGQKQGPFQRLSGHPLPVLTIPPACSGRGTGFGLHGKLVQMH
jgi:hypothetical protein